MRSPRAYRTVSERLARAVLVPERPWGPWSCVREERAAYGASRVEPARRPSLVDAIERRVLHAVTAERAAAYLAILGALLAMRRDHELLPLVDDVERRVAGDEPGEREAFARDLAQLAEWGCVERQIEPLRIRGYKDARRERFRYRLSADAVALLEWLEARAQERRSGGGPDGRDILADLLGHARELVRVCAPLDGGSAGGVRQLPEGAPRRALHLLSAMDDRAAGITEELIGLRAQMLGFTSGAYDGGSLREMLRWLERYVGVHLAAVHALRADIEEQLAALSTDATSQVLDACKAALEDERAQTPRAIRAGMVLRAPGAQVAALRSFFGPSGRLFELCAQTDASAREVVRKLHCHLVELERRSARRDELTRAIAWVRSPSVDGAVAAAWLGALLASAQVRSVPVGDGRIAPPLPRRHVRSSAGAPPPFLALKEASDGPPRSSRQKLREELAAWLEAVLGPRERVRMSEVAVSIGLPPSNGRHWTEPRRWIDLARARHLGRGRELHALGVRVERADGVGVAHGSGWRIESPDFVIARRTDLARRGS